MLATQILKTEHRAIEVMLNVLEKICIKLQNNEMVEIEHLERILDFLKTFVDKCHHGKEEDLLFPTLERTGIPKEGGPIGVMLHEHSHGREYIEQLAKAIEEYKNGNRQANQIIVNSAKNYISLMRDHIKKEDNVLFQIADQHLSPEKQKELVEEFDKLENEKIGAGKHEEFHRLIDHLKEIYL